MIRAFALEPRLVATWARIEEFRFISDKFGLGTPRVLLEMPAFTKWKRAVFDAAAEIGLSQQDLGRLAELFRAFQEHKCRRPSCRYDGQLAWLLNVETEFARKPFGAILATQNPRRNPGVLVPEQLLPTNERWNCTGGATPARTPEAFAQAVAEMLLNCDELHFVDQYFRPDDSRHRDVLEAMMSVVALRDAWPRVIRVHCSDRTSLAFFEHHAARMAATLPSGAVVEFVRWAQRDQGEILHNRYVLTDIGGVSFGVGLDAGRSGESDDVILLPKPVYEKRWAQYARGEGFDCVDNPAAIRGQRVRGRPLNS